MSPFTRVSITCNFFIFIFIIYSYTDVLVESFLIGNDPANRKRFSISPRSSFSERRAMTSSLRMVSANPQPKNSPSIIQPKRKKPIAQHSVNNTKTNIHKKKYYKNKRHSSPSPFQYKNKKSKIKSLYFAAKNFERTGQWRKAEAFLEQAIRIDPTDSRSHLAIAKLQARREERKQSSLSREDNNEVAEKHTLRKAREAFRHGTEMCPDSVHLWQAWALYEQNAGDESSHQKAAEYYEKALSIESTNPYVCHAFGLMERNAGNLTGAQLLWEKAIPHNPTAAILCSLGDLYASSPHNNPEKARELYSENVLRIRSGDVERQRTEVFLAAASLEERYFSNINSAIESIQKALELSPQNGRALVALVRLEGKLKEQQKNKKSLSKTENVKSHHISHHAGGKTDLTKVEDRNLIQNAKQNGTLSISPLQNMRDRFEEICTSTLSDDGRLFNAWANLEIKEGNLEKAKEILDIAMTKFPKDQSVSK